MRRAFTADAPNQLWVADITYVPTYAGFLYLAVVPDAFSRRVVGWGMSSSLHAAVVPSMALVAVQRAAAQRRPAGVVHHSDQESQHGAPAFGQRCTTLGVRPSMGSRGDAYGKAMAESFFATLECELLARRRFATHAEARVAIFRCVEGWYNPHRGVTRKP